MKRLILSFCTGLACFSLSAQSPVTYSNPVIPGDVADPTIIRAGDVYYAAGTSSEWAPFYPLFQSYDLVNWRQVGHLFDEQPAWTKSSFWAPELFYHRGTYYVYYTARRKSDGVSYIGVATSDKPSGPYTDRGVVVEYGTEAIDAFILEDEGQLYISWKAYGLDDRPIELLGCRLSADGLRLEGEPFTLLKDDERRGMEGQHWLKLGDYYYLIYSVNGCCGPKSDYAVSVARSKSLQGPYEKYEGNPILHGGDEIQSCGHGTVTTTPDGRMYYLCHAYFPGEDFFMGRQPILQELVLGDDAWLHFKEGETASKTHPLPLAGHVQQPVPDFYDDFTSDRLRVEWTWNYPFATPRIQLFGGRLSLSGEPKAGAEAGTALCLRPVAADYTFETVVLNQNDVRKGVTMYGDDRNLLSLVCRNNQLELCLRKEGKETPLAAPVILPIPERGEKPVYLRLQVKAGCQYAFFYSLDGKSWTQIKQQVQNADLVQWDRVARPGLYYEGKTGEALFEYALMRNQH